MGLISVLKQTKRHLTLPLVVGWVLSPTLAFSADVSSYEHENPGCQINSICDKESGLKRLAWKQTVKTKNINKINQAISDGKFPLGIWFTGEKLSSSILWKSVCHAHQGKNIKMGKLFVKDLKSINNFDQFSPENFVFSDFVTYQKGREIISFIAPINESPSSIRNGKMVFTLGDMGDIYTVTISSVGKIEAVRADSDYHPTYSTQCPKEMLEKSVQLPTKFPLTVTPYCRTIWNETEKGYETVMVHPFCP